MKENRMEDPVDSWRRSRHPEPTIWANGDAADEIYEGDGWRELQELVSLPAPCDLPLAILDRMVAASALKKYDLAVVENKSGERSNLPLGIEARNRVEPGHLSISGFTQDLSPNSSHERPEVSRAGLSTRHTTPPAKKAFSDPTQPLTESNRSIGISSDRGRQSRKTLGLPTSKATR